MATGLVGISGFDPISNVTPFTYKDGATYLQILETLKDQANALVSAVNTLDEGNASEHSRIARELTAQFNKALDDLRYELEQAILGSHDESIAWDPTTGSRIGGLSQVVSNVYDNLRYYAYFAKQLDEFEWTAAEYDAMQLGARHFDLGFTYPVFNAVLPE